MSTTNRWSGPGLARDLAEVQTRGFELLQDHGQGGSREEAPTGHPRPTEPRTSAYVLYRLQRVLRPNRFYRWLGARIESSPAVYRLFTAAEEKVKADVFGCRMCGQCALPATGYACPMSCPKQLRNGPCGGVGADGSCEVYPTMRCVWVTAYERAEREGHTADLCRLQRPVDHRRQGQSSWVNYWQGRDEGLWTDDGLTVRPTLTPAVGAGDPR